MQTNDKTYQSPEIDLILVGVEDILTLSNAGFAGEEHEFELPMP